MESPAHNESAEARLKALESELERKTQRVVQLEKVNKDLNEKVQGAVGAQPTADLSELERTLTSMLTRTAMILQGSKCLFLVQDPGTKELYPGKPAVGFDDLDLSGLRIPDGAGLSGACFKNEEPTFLYDAEADELAPQETFAQLGIKNGLAFPLTVEKRDEETNKVVERRTVGVLWVLNKKFGGIFADEDVFLFRTLAARTAAVINAASSLHQIVEEKEQLHEMTDALTAGLVMIGKNGRVLQMNSSARRVFGIGAGESFGGQSYSQIIKNDEVKEVLRRALDEQIDIEEEVSLEDAEDATRTFQVQSTVIRNEASEITGMAAIFSDVTELKNIDKMKSAFVATVSHELRTPLTGIKGFIATLLEDTDGFYDSETRLEFYGIIDKECDRLKRLIDDLLNVSRIEANAAMQLNFDAMDLRETLKKSIAIDGGSTYKKDNHTLTFAIDDDVPATIEADADKFEQILHNVVGNALKYSPDGGDVKVHVAMQPGGEMLQFAVSDQGLGMSPEFLKKFGERFARADNRDTRSINGTGIGIFLVKNFIEGHGGTMWPHSDGVGKGTTIYFTLPIKQDEDGNTDDRALARSVAG